VHVNAIRHAESAIDQLGEESREHEEQKFHIQLNGQSCHEEEFHVA
jgi:hypothetical protein